MAHMGMDQLDDRARETLDFERSCWKFAGAKESEVLDRFGESATRYYQRLNALIDQPAAIAYDPMTVRRLQRLRERRHAQRAARRMPTG